MNVEWSDRVAHWIRTLKMDLYEPLSELSWEAFQTMEYLTPEEALQAQFLPVQEGFVWGRTYEYCWFKADIQLPKRAQGERILLDLKPGGESTLFVNGDVFGTYRADWVREPLHFMEDNTLTRKGCAGERYQILMETYAGHFYPVCESGNCATGPVLPGTFEDSVPDGERRTLGRCTYGIWNEVAYQLYMDVDTLWKLFTVLDQKSLRAAKIAEALEEFTLTVEFEQERAGRIADYQKASAQLRPVLEAVNGSTMPVFYGVGNAHLDLAWLWPMAETYRKTARTFAAQLRLMEEYPAYKFIQSQPAAYEMCRAHYPELFEKIKDAVKRGQWIAEGAMWVEPDTNLAGGEALIRQLLYGKRYFKETFGVESRLLWLPDTFGYSAALPQLLKGCGIEYLVTQKIFWSYNEGDQFPYNYFTWEGMDGSKIVSFLPTSYTYRTDPEEVNRIWENRTQIRNLEAFLLPYGYGDGGGGPTRDYIEYAKRQENLEGSVKIKMADPLEFFEDMEAMGGPSDTYVGELYFSAHRGTYTSQAMVKKKNRRAEAVMREAEYLGALASLKGWTYPARELESLWKELLLQQFHDILPGSSIARVYWEAEKCLENIRRRAEEIAEEAAGYLQEEPVGEQDEEAVSLFHSLSFSRKALVELPPAFASGVCDEKGTILPSGREGDRVKAIVELPACGALTLYPSAKAGEPAWKECATIQTLPNGFLMENQEVKVTVNQRGEILSFIRKESGREFVKDTMNCLRFYKDVPRAFDAWDIDSHYSMQELEGAYDISIEAVSEGVEAVIKVTGKIGVSSYTQYLRLPAFGCCMAFETIVDWRELHRLLKVAFPVQVYSEMGRNEIQFGYVERPTHRSRAYDQDRFEVCNHRYSALCDGAAGAAVLNDGKYGISMNGSSLELSLLRASASPEMRADNKEHHFTYAFTAWEGGFADCDVVRQGYGLNNKPLVKKGRIPAFSFLQIEKENIIMETMKLAEDGSGDLILRFYESKKASTKTQITFAAVPGRIWLCDMLENRLEEVQTVGRKAELSFAAFEVKTVRVSKMLFEQ